MAEADDLLVGEDNLDSLDDTNGNINMTETSFNLEGDGASNGLASGEGAGSAGAEDPELAAIKARVREMEEEAEKLRQLQDADKNMIMGSPPGVTGPLALSLEEKIEVDNRSVYVGNVDYGATAEELEQHFHGCGSINRVTILCNKFDGHPKGFAYIEFGDKDCIHTAMAMDESLFRGRQIKVMPKRTNKPGVTTTNRFPRGMRARGRGSRGYYGGFRGMRRPRRGVYYSPY